LQITVQLLYTITNTAYNNNAKNTNTIIVTAATNINVITLFQINYY